MSYYDQMQVCENGHQITDRARGHPELRVAFCKDCGAQTLDSCINCGAPIKGEYVIENAWMAIVGFETPVPSYCDSCGKAYPWRAAALVNLAEIVREGDLSEAELAEFDAIIPDIARDTPKSESAALKLKRIFGRLRKPTYEIAVKVVTDIASETAKKTLGL